MENTHISKRGVVITGATSGLGKEIALLVTEQLKDRTYLLYRNREKFDSIWDKKDIVPVYYDFSEKYEGEYSELIDISGLDRVIAVLAGYEMSPIKPIVDLDFTMIEKSVHTNILGQINLVLMLIKICKQQQKNLDIIWLDSGAAHSYILGWALYSSSKAYMNVFLEHVSNVDGVRVVLYSPGTLNTPMQEYIREQRLINTTAYFERKYNDGELRNPRLVAQDIVDRYIIQWTAKSLSENVSNTEMRMKYTEE